MISIGDIGRIAEAERIRAALPRLACS